MSAPASPGQPHNCGNARRARPIEQSAVPSHPVRGAKRRPPRFGRAGGYRVNLGLTPAPVRAQSAEAFSSAQESRTSIDRPLIAERLNERIHRRNDDSGARVGFLTHRSERSERSVLAPALCDSSPHYAIPPRTMRFLPALCDSSPHYAIPPRTMPRGRQVQMHFLPLLVRERISIGGSMKSNQTI